MLVTSSFGAAPDWATSNVDNTHNTLSSILKDPMSLVEGIAQGASDAVDTKGICYASGYIVGSLIGIKGMDKLGKAVKAGIGGAKSGIAINSVDDLAKVGYSKDVLAKMGINSSDDIVRLGLDSVDDLERLKAKLLELEKGASGAGRNIIDKAKINGKRIGDMNKQEIINSVPVDWEVFENNGFVHIKDEKGITRIRIDTPDNITPIDHIHIYDEFENPLNIDGIVKDRKSPEVHIPLNK